MKYALFAWENYHAAGGWNDVIAVSNNPDLLQKDAEDLMIDDGYAQIVDLVDWIVVAQGFRSTERKDRREWDWEADG